MSHAIVKRQNSEQISDKEAIRPLRVEILEKAIQDMRRRLAATRWPDKETVTDQSQGAFQAFRAIFVGGGGGNMKKLGFLVLVVSLLIGSSAFAQTRNSVRAKPTIILVHGAWADGSSWNKQIGPLVAAGYKVIAVQNPTTSLADDVAATIAAIDRAGGDVILVGHSWGGSVISEAGADPRVKALVYIAAFAPDKGESIGSLNQTAAPTEVQNFLLETNGTLTLTRQGVSKVFAADLSATEQDIVFAVQPPASPKIFSEVAVNSAWKTKPSWFVVASEDKAIDPELQKTMAKRAGAKTTIVKASHVPMLSKPNEVLKVILDASASVGR